MVTQNEHFTLFEPNEEGQDAGYSGFSLQLKDITLHVHEVDEFNYHQLRNKEGKFFVTNGEESLNEAKGFFTKEEAYEYAEKMFQKNLNSLIHELQELIN